MKRERIKELPIYPEQRLCKRPTTEQILRLFSLAERHTLLRDDQSVQSFPPNSQICRLRILDLLGVPAARPSSADRTGGNSRQIMSRDVRNVSLEH